MKTRSAFTIAELIVVIVVIAILATIATLTLTSTQQRARDNQRATNVIIVTEALEEYYSSHGEYPTVTQMTNSDTATVEELLGLQDGSSLVAPSSSSDVNSWSTGTPTLTKSMTYSGNTDTSASCQTGTATTDACDDYKIQYYNEEDKTISTVLSRNSTSSLAAVTPDTPGTAPTITLAAPVGANVTATATATSCPTGGTPNFSFSTRTNNGAWSAWSAYSPTKTYTSAASVEGSKYGWRVKQQCVAPGTTSGDSPFSDEAVYIRPITTVPAIPAPYTTQSFRPYGLSSTRCIDATGGGGVGTLLQLYTCNSTSAQDWAWNSNDGTLRPVYNLNLCATSAGLNAQMTLQTCDGSNIRKWTRSANGKFQNVSNSYCINVLGGAITNGTAINTVACDSTAIEQMWNPADSQSLLKWAAVTCPAGQTANYQVKFKTSGGIADSSWANLGTATSVLFSNVNQGYTYTNEVQANCTTANYDGPWSASGQASIEKAVMPPSKPTSWVYSLVNTDGRKDMTWSWTFSMSCATGNNLFYQEDTWLSGPGDPVYWLPDRLPTGVGAVGWWYENSTNYQNAYSTYGPNPVLKNSTRYFSSVGTPAPTSGVQTENKVRGYCENPTTLVKSPMSDWTVSGKTTL